jgi:hypothetical protein
MEGDDAVRFCGQCRKNVYNVAQLSRAEAIALIERAEGRVCVQLTRRSDGTIATGDCWTQLRRARKRGLLALAAAAPAILAAQLWSEGFGLRALAGLFHRPRPALSVPSPMGGSLRRRDPPDFVVAPPITYDATGGIASTEEIEFLGKLAPPAPKKKTRR